MEKTLSVHKKETKQVKNKKKPVKVVYINNPMKVKINASGFRALVQELTGQDADVQEPSKFSAIDGVGGGQLEAANDATKVMKDHHALERPSVQQPTYEVMPETSNYSFHGYDNVDFTPQMMLENFPGLVPSNLWYETSHVADML